MKKFALLTVSDKRGIVKFAAELRRLGFELVGSLKTARLLKKNKIKVTEVSLITQYPAIMGKQGIKLIHPKIFGAILADKKKRKHLAECKKYEINPFDIVVCNFYPFGKTISEKKGDHAAALFNLDIGGPAMVRCAAKNYQNVVIIVDVKDYASILRELRATGDISLKTRKKLSLKAFRYAYRYDEAIIRYLAKKFNEKTI